MKNTDNIFALTKQDTAVLKGIAIIAMLMHHLWGCPPAGMEPYMGILVFLGSVGKVCVAIFLFCSGYGLSVGYRKTIEDGNLKNEGWKGMAKYTLKFLSKRFVKFYAGYWPIFLIFVPIGIFVFGRTLADAYGPNLNILKRFVFDVLAINGCPPYNITWWFNFIIISLYLLFPLFYHLIRIKPWIAIIVGFVIMQFSSYMPYNPSDICIWQFPFVLGITWHYYEDRGTKIQQWITGHKYIAIIVSLCVLCGLMVIRRFPIIPHFSGIKVDGFISCALAVCLITILRYLRYIMSIFAFLGKHSMNIYLTHTFFFSYWFPTFFYSRELGGGYKLYCPSRSLFNREYGFRMAERNNKMEQNIKYNY